jgi:hypothetical protein
MDQLFDSGRQFRKEKKAKKQQRILEAVSKETEYIQAENGDDEEINLDMNDSDNNGDKKQGSKGKSKKRTPRKKETRKDMYKALDGSALLCIG